MTEIPEGQNLGRYHVIDKAFVAACGAGHSEVVNYILHELSSPRKLLWEHRLDRMDSGFGSEKKEHEAFEAAADGGHLEIIQTLVAAYKSASTEDPNRPLDFLPLSPFVNSRAIINAAKKDHSDVLEFLVKEFRAEYKSHHRTRDVPDLPRGTTEAIVAHDSVASLRKIKPFLSSYEVGTVNKPQV